MQRRGFRQFATAPIAISSTRPKRSRYHSSALTLYGGVSNALEDFQPRLNEAFGDAVAARPETLALYGDIAIRPARPH